MLQSVRPVSFGAAATNAMDPNLVTTLIGLFLALTFGVSAVLYASKQNRLSRRQMELQEAVILAEGSLLKSKTSSCFFDANSPKKIYLLLDSSDQHFLEVPFPLKINNEGHKTALHLTIYVQLPNALLYSGALDDIEFGESALLKIRGVKIALEKGKSFSTLVFSVPRLPTFESYTLYVPVAIKATTHKITESIAAKTKDGVDIIFDLNLAFAATEETYDINVRQTAENEEPRSVNYRLIVIDKKEATPKAVFDAKSQAALRIHKTTTFGSIRVWAFHIAKFLTSKNYRSKCGLESILIYEPSEFDLIQDRRASIRRYRTSRATHYTGKYDPENQTFWIPAIGTTFFGIGR